MHGRAKAHARKSCTPFGPEKLYTVKAGPEKLYTVQALFKKVIDTYGRNLYTVHINALEDAYGNRKEEDGQATIKEASQV